MSEPGYEISPPNKFLAVLGSIHDFETHPGRTVTMFHQVDLSEVEQLRAGVGSCKPSYTALVIKTVALALREFPQANRRVVWKLFGGPRAQQFHRCDVAVACERDLPDAPMVAFMDIVRDADRLSLPEINTWLRRLRASDLSNNPQWATFHWLVARLPRWVSQWVLRLPIFFPGMWLRYRGGAVLVTSPAKYGVDVVASTWTYPLGVSFGLVKKRPVVRGDEVVARPTFTLLVNVDRRLLAGAQAARFFRRMIDILENAQTTLAPFLVGDVEQPRPREVANDSLPEFLAAR